MSVNDSADAWGSAFATFIRTSANLGGRIGWCVGSFVIGAPAILLVMLAATVAIPVFMCAAAISDETP